MKAAMVQYLCPGIPMGSTPFLHQNQVATAKNSGVATGSFSTCIQAIPIAICDSRIL